MSQKDSPELISMLNKSLASMTIEEIDSLNAKWLGSESTRKNEKRIRFTPEEQAYLVKKGTIRMCVDPDWMPFEKIDQHGMYIGMAADTLDLVQQRSALSLELVRTRSWTESIAFAKARKCDIFSLAMETPERKQYMDFTTPYFIFPFVIATKTEELFVEKLEDVLDKTLVMVKGFAYVEILKNRYPDIKLIETNNMLEGLQLVREGKAYGFIDTLATIAYTIQKEGMVDIKIAGKFDDNWELGIGTRNDEPLLNSIFEKALTTVSEKEKRQIYNNWFSIRYEEGIDYSLIRKVVLGFIALIIAIFWRYLVLRRSRNEAEEAKAQAEHANQSKSVFLANMSHEVRTPLNAILGFTEILKSRIEDPQLSNYLDSIHSSGESLLSLINDILDLSKVEAGRLELEYTAVSPEELFNEMQTVFGRKITDKKLKLLIDIPPGLPKALLLDQTRLRQILINLIGNAVKFTETGYIRLSINFSYPVDNSHSTLDLIFSVEDTGKGIHQDHLESIFEAFTQSKGQKISQFGGTGLGLAITKRLIEIMAGKIEVVSEVDKGSTFKVILKDVEITSVEAAEFRRRKQIGWDASRFRSIRFEKSSVLVVDDIEFNREIIKDFLADYDITTLEAKNGREAMEEARKHHPQLILLDIKMPEMDGYEASGILKNDDELKEIPVVAITALAMKKDEELIGNLCDSYLRKPVSKTELISEIMKYLPHTVDESVVSDVAPEETPEELSPETWARLPELLEILKKEQTRCEEISKQQARHEMKNLALEMKELGKKYGYPPLLRWSEDLFSSIVQLDIEKIEGFLQNFQTFTQSMENDIKLHSSR